MSALKLPEPKKTREPPVFGPGAYRSTARLYAKGEHLTLVYSETPPSLTSSRQELRAHGRSIVKAEEAVTRKQPKRVKGGTRHERRKYASGPISRARKAAEAAAEAKAEAAAASEASTQISDIAA